MEDKSKEYTEHVERISQAVAEYAIINVKLIPDHIRYNPESRRHIINIGTSIMMAKWKIGPKPGSFVKAVVDNDLTKSVHCADAINRHMLPFYVILKYNMGYIT